MVQQRIVHIILFVFLSFLAKAQEERSLIRAGNKFFSDSNYVMADSMYLKARDINPESIEAQYNYANSLYNKNDYEGAVAEYNNLLNGLEDKQKKAIANHNLGNAHLKLNQPEEAITAFKNALRNNPRDEESRYNLAYAQSLLQKNKNGQNKNDQNNQDQNKDDQQKQKNQENKENKDDQQGKDSDSKKDPNEEQKQKKDGKKNPDEKGDQPDDQGEKDKSKEGDKQEKGDEKGKDEGEQNKDSKEKPGEENNGEQPGKEGKEVEEKSDKNGQGKKGQSEQEPQKAKAISKATAEQLLKELENDEKAIREKMIRSQMKQKPRKKIEKDW